MWCEKCQADVATTASVDNQRLLCVTCGTAVNRRQGGAQSPGPSSRKTPLADPRELLARWAREDALGSLDPDILPIGPRTSAERPALRFDSAHGIPRPPEPVVERVAEQSASSPVTPAVPRVELQPPSAAVHVIVDAPHGLQPPHFPLAPALAPEPSSNWVTLVGQICAYFGVGGLTIGTVFVLMGYFGGPASYTTTGWLVATAGQMLLFLGVVTLISGGMEQTTHEVARRIDTLGERLVRIEQAALSGASGSAGAGPAAPKS
ncbi:MAG: hypothetical protein ACT4QC_10995 [Planctomycetaceae bacterium]